LLLNKIFFNSILNRNANRIAIIAKGSGFSHSFSAVNTKCYHVAKILQEYGLRVVILSSIYYQEKPISKKTGKYKGVAFYAPSCHIKTQSKIVKAVHKIAYTWRVISFLTALRFKFGKSYYIFDDNGLFLPFLVILSWFGVVELIFNIEEWPAAHDMPLKNKIVSHLFVVLALKNCRKVVCVSSFLVDKAFHYNRHSTSFRLPSITAFSAPVTDTSLINSHQDACVNFLYCGNVGYYEVIDTIIRAFDAVCRSREKSNVKLVLIISGDQVLLQKILNQIKEIHSPIQILTHVTDAELFEEYGQATCLLAPLRNTLQDQARFPQKISEYTSLSKPIITTKVGDIDQYFESDKSAIFIEDFSASEIQKKFEYVIDNPNHVYRIGVEGNMVGRKYFDYHAYVSSFGRFVTS